MEEGANILIYNTQDGKASVSLLTKDGMVWMNQSQLAELFDTSKQNISLHRPPNRNQTSLNYDFCDVYDDYEFHTHSSSANPKIL